MKNEYVAAKMEIVKMDGLDIITTSVDDGGNTTNSIGDNDTLFSLK